VVPETFNTYADASMALDEYLDDMDYEFESGNIDSPYNRDEFKIVEVAT
jgi:hypothetical protein